MPLLALLLIAASSPAAPPLPDTIDLTRPFATRTPWRLAATQGPAIPDPILGEGTVPGAVRLCLGHPGGACQPDVPRLLTPPGGADPYAEAHDLLAARIVHPRDHTPLLLLRVGSLHGANGDQRIATALFAYDRAADRFTHRTGRNNNQEVRYIDAGPLAGDVIVAEPTRTAPFAYWISVSAPGTRAHPYRQLLRYRSSVRYGDGDPRPVIDAEMPAILRHLPKR